MDSDKTNAEDNSVVKTGSNTAVRNSLVANCGTDQRKKDGGDGKRRRGSTSDDSGSSPRRKKRKKSKKLKKKKSKKRKSKKVKKRKRDGSEDTSTSEDGSDESDGRAKRRSKKCKKKSSDKEANVVGVVGEESFGPAVPEEIAAKSKAMAPMSKEEWERRQSVTRRVYDEDSGRYRLVRGDGEILEECVSRDRHREINRQATAADGLYFQNRLKEK